MHISFVTHCAPTHIICVSHRWYTHKGCVWHTNDTHDAEHTKDTQWYVEKTKYYKCYLCDASDIRDEWWKLWSSHEGYKVIREKYQRPDLWHSFGTRIICVIHVAFVTKDAVAQIRCVSAQMIHTLIIREKDQWSCAICVIHILFVWNNVFRLCAEGVQDSEGERKGVRDHSKWDYWSPTNILALFYF